MATPTPYRSLPAARRVALVSHAISSSRDARALYAQRLVARGGGYRAVTVKSWAPERLATEIVRMKAETAQDELDLLQILYVELEPAIQVAFLDEAGVRHENGTIPEEVDPPYANAEAVRRAATLVHEQHGDEGMRYLRTLVRYFLEAWPGIDGVVVDLGG